MQAMREDGYYNAVMGHGLHKTDPRKHWAFQMDDLMGDQALASLYTGNALARKIIDLPADEAVKNWIKINAAEKTQKYIAARLNDLDAEFLFADALRWGRLYGGAAMALIVDDGQDITEPLKLESIRRLEDIRIYDKTEVYPNFLQLYDDPSKASYGKPQTYEVNSCQGNHFTIHESRLLIFDGLPAPHRYKALFQDWGISVLQGLTDQLRDCINGYGFASLLLERASQPVYKMPDLGGQLETEDGEELVMKRLHLIDMARSMLNTILLDKEEEYEILTASLTNVPELIDQFGIIVSGMVNIPYTLLFGRSAAGMNATGESDFENYYNMVRQIQKKHMKKKLNRLVGIFLAEQGAPGEKEYEIEFMPLWLPSEKEISEAEKYRADKNKAEAETAQIYIDSNALDPSELRNTLKEKQLYDIDPSNDIELGGTDGGNA